MSNWEQTAAEVLRAAKFLYRRNMVNAYEGNVSARLGDHLLITPSQVCKEELTEADLVEVDLATGETVFARNGRVASSETKVHICVYQARPDIGGVCHAHPPFSTTFAVRGEPIWTDGYPEMMLLYGKVPICRYGRPSTQAVCDEIPDVLRDYDDFLLENHGLVTSAITVREAAYRLESIESIAGVLFRARTLGGINPLPAGEAEAIEAMRQKKRHSK